MGNYEQLKQAVSDVIKTNGNQEITGAILQNALLSIISTIGTNATFAGIATPTTNPGTPDQNVFYIASENGTYSNFNSISLNDEVVILSNKNGNWEKFQSGIASDIKLNNISSDSYPYVLSSKTIYENKSYIDLNNTIQTNNSTYRIRKIQVKQNDIIFIQGKVSGSIVSGLYSSEIPSNSNVLEQYVKAYAGKETKIDINKKAISDGYLLISENVSMPLLVVVNPVFADRNSLSSINSVLGLNTDVETKNYTNSVLYTSGNKSAINGYDVLVIKLNVGDNIDYFIQGQGTYMLAGVYNSYDLSQDTFKKVLSSVTLSENIKTVNANYYCEEEEYIAFSIKKELASYFKFFLNSKLVFNFKFNEELNRIDTSILEIRKLIKNISIYKTINNSYLNPTGSGMSYSTNVNYAIDLYDVSDFIGYYIQILGGVKGFINIWGFVDNEEINEENTILKGDNWNENTKITPYEKTIIVPNGAKYLCITRYKGENNTIKSEVITTSFIEKQIETIQEEIEKINKSVGISDNIAWTLKTKVDEMLSAQYPSHNIPLLSRLNNRYNFGDVKITENITIPNISKSVIINVDKNPDVNGGYSSTKKMFNIDDKICIGTKDIYDLYLIKNITELSFECELLECNTNLIGEILQKETSYTNSVSSETAIDYVHVYKYNDILSYQSNELPRSISFDGVHPNVDGRSINSFIIADVISSLYGKPTKIYSFGDSWTAETQGWVEVGTILNCQMVNKGISGDRIEHIIKRFLEFMESYSESEGDVFLFVMGTNNLLDITRNGDDKNKQLYNSSYISIFKEACEIISEKLPKGNWFIANGHKNSESIF